MKSNKELGTIAFDLLEKLEGQDPNEQLFIIRLKKGVQEDE